MPSSDDQGFRTESRPFALGEMYSYRGAVVESEPGGPRRRVAVVGAGIAGLTAAYELRACDHDVTVFEASPRVGGRIRTARFADGTHGELGAMRIPANHGGTLHYVETFGLATRPFINANERAKYSIRGAVGDRTEWRKVASMFDLRDNERKDPLLLYETLMQYAMAMLSAEEKRQLFAGDYSSDQVRAYDNQTLWQYLRRWLSPEAIHYVGHATGMIWYEHASFLEALVDYFGLFRVDSVTLADGMDALPRAFASALCDAVHCSAKVTEITVTESGVRIGYVSPAGRQSSDFDCVVCAVPATQVPYLEFNPPLPPAQADAYRRITYASGAKTLLHCCSRPWEYVEGIAGGGSFTDLPIQQCWYPADNATGGSSSSVVAATGDDPEIGGGVSRAQSAWGPLSREVAHGPGVLTGAYLWEVNARRFAALSESDRTDLVLGSLRKLHPSLTEADVIEVVHVVWDESVGGGTYAFYAPGDYHRYHRLLSQPLPAEAPRVFFAGEHLAVSHAWIQGAVQSGWDAALAVTRVGHVAARRSLSAEATHASSSQHKELSQ